MRAPLSIFLSSPCYDLIDVRDQISDLLVQDGNLVYRSDDPLSSFAPAPQLDSIESCLLNVHRCDAVICIIDRRYGPLLNGVYGKISATHLEVNHAKKRVPFLPILTFMRDQAFSEYMKIKAPETRKAETKWILQDTENTEETRDRYVSLVKELTALRHGRNWFDQFRSSLDLGKIIRKRLIENFPGRYNFAASDPSRIVRLFFTRDTAGGWHLRNPHGQPVFDVWVYTITTETYKEVMYINSLSPGASQKVGFPNGRMFLPDEQLACQYQTVSGDVFRVIKGLPDSFFVFRDNVLPPQTIVETGYEYPTYEWTPIAFEQQRRPDFAEDLMAHVARAKFEQSEGRAHPPEDTSEPNMDPD